MSYATNTVEVPSPNTIKLTEGRAARDLLEMLRTMRPDNSKTESDFCAKWIEPLGAKQDTAGNWILEISKANGKRTDVLWSSHTDTVHSKGGRQVVQLIGDTISLAPKSKASNCLGADCTTGVWIMREMVLASVPGLYIWHAAEECGGQGSSYIAKKTPEAIEGIRFAIAFDRKGKTSVITHQGGLRCCSNVFSDSLAAMLPGTYSHDTGGSFTDTANYVGLIPECTNISVGYDWQHTSRETQSMSHALALRAAMLVFDEDKLVESRKPGEVEYDDLDDRYGSWLDRAFPLGNKSERPHTSLLGFIKEHPELVADLLEQYGVTVDDMYDEYPEVRPDAY